MDIAVSQKNRFSILALSGRLDALTAPAFEKEARNLLDQGIVFVVADMTGLEFVSSAGLRGILSLAKGLRAKQGELRFAGLQPAVREVFTFSGFTNLFSIFETVEEAAV